MKWQDEGYSLEMQSLGRRAVVFAYDKRGNFAGRADLSFGTHFYQGRHDSLFVPIEHRRKGLASAMYDLIERTTGKFIIKAEDGGSSLGDLFWEARLSKLSKNHPALEHNF